MKTVWTELSPPAGPCRPLLVFLCPVGLFSFSWTDVIFAKGHSSRKPSEEAQSITSCFLSHTQQNLKTKLGSHAQRNLFQQENIFFSPAFTQGKDHSEYLFFFFFYLIGWKKSSWKNDIILNFFIDNFFCFVSHRTNSNTRKKLFLIKYVFDFTQCMNIVFFFLPLGFTCKKIGVFLWGGGWNKKIRKKKIQMFVFTQFNTRQNKSIIYVFIYFFWINISEKIICWFHWWKKNINLNVFFLGFTNRKNQISLSFLMCEKSERKVQGSFF